MEAASVPQPQASPGKRATDFVGAQILWILLGGVLLILLINGPRPDAQQRRRRALDRLGLGADRARLHARLRHHRADQLRPRRGLHDRLVHLGLALRDARDHREHKRDRADLRAAARARDLDGRLRRAQRDDRARRLPAAAQRAQAGAADHRDRDVLHPAERRPALAPDARLAAGPDPLAAAGVRHRRRHVRALRHLRLGGHDPAADRAPLLRRRRPSTARPCAPPRRTPTPPA